MFTGFVAIFYLSNCQRWDYIYNTLKIANVQLFLTKNNKIIIIGKKAQERIGKMKEYEVIWEIFNKCPRNQMRDVFVEEVEIEDPEAYIRSKFQGDDVSFEKTLLADGTVVFDIQTSQIKQRCSFTEI